MEILAVAKKLEWDVAGRDVQWNESRYGFSIIYNPLLYGNYQYNASWGEGQSDDFASLYDAQQWCQAIIDEWVRNNVTLALKEED